MGSLGTTAAVTGQAAFSQLIFETRRGSDRRERSSLAFGFWWQSWWQNAPLQDTPIDTRVYSTPHLCSVPVLVRMAG